MAAEKEKKKRTGTKGAHVTHRIKKQKRPTDRPGQEYIRRPFFEQGR
jgi:hypothetical protein